eukprot:TRINITY_DN3565_c0_g1_i1.p1 TRINITY_DN3565_c0_g1~~TRINITY_DN3565_c0_g1_i1.p1  ORF type:complete len:201 (-),score=61.55 TRINITY_DN3565_c0_g1_i1:221-823(-)
MEFTETEAEADIHRDLADEVAADVERFEERLCESDLISDMVSLGLDVPNIMNEDDMLSCIEEVIRMYESTAGVAQSEEVVQARVEELERECRTLSKQVVAKGDVRRIRILDRMLDETPSFRDRSLADIAAFLEEVQQKRQRATQADAAHVMGSRTPSSSTSLSGVAADAEGREQSYTPSTPYTPAHRKSAFSSVSPFPTV